MKRKIFYIIVLILFFSISTGGILFSQEEGEEETEEIPQISYGLGDQMFSINAGLFIPLFFFGGGSAVSTNLSLGGVGSLEWNAFVTEHLTLGGELAGSFSFSPLKRTLVIIPVTFKVGYFFFAYPFEIPIYLGTGVNFITLEDSLYVGLILKPGASFYWNINGSWAAGLNVVYWFSPQWYTKEELVSQNRYGNFLEVSLSALYHF